MLDQVSGVRIYPRPRTQAWKGTFGTELIDFSLTELPPNPAKSVGINPSSSALHASVCEVGTYIMAPTAGSPSEFRSPENIRSFVWSRCLLPNSKPNS